MFAEVLDESTGEPIEEGQGLLVLTRPWPSMLRTLYREEDRFVETYFKRFGRETYLVGDASRRDRDGYLWVIGRIDDVVNVSGHRMSTAEVESAIVAHEDVAEAAVIGQHDEDTGQAIVAFVTLQGDVEGDDRTVEGIRDTVAARIGKFARPKRVIWTDDLPKTRSGKIMRRLLRDIADGHALGDVTTLRDPAVMERLQEQVKTMPGRRGGLSPAQTLWCSGAQEPSSERLKSWNSPGASAIITRAISSNTSRISSSAPGAVRISITWRRVRALAVHRMSVLRPVGASRRSAEVTSFLTWKGTPSSSIPSSSAASRWNSSSCSTIESTRSRTGSSAGGTRKPMSVRRT